MPHDFPTKGVSDWDNFPGDTFRNREKLFKRFSLAICYELLISQAGLL